MTTDKLCNIYEFLETIRPKLSMYLGNTAICNLETYLYGYCAALGVHRISEEGVPDFRYFLKWLMRTRYNAWACGWAHGLLHECNGDNDAALALFFELVAGFSRLTPRSGECLELPPNQRRSEDFMRLNSNHHPIPSRLQLVYLQPGDWCYLRYWYGEDTVNQWDLYANVETALKFVEWEFNIGSDKWDITSS
ncbi:MAG: hypothetical protein ACOYMQ_18690 [Pseudanabaena sp.]